MPKTWQRPSKILGYKVMLKTNVGRKAMIEAVQDFGDKLRSQGGIFGRFEGVHGEIPLLNY